jgi:hypothetical protein
MVAKKEGVSFGRFNPYLRWDWRAWGRLAIYMLAFIGFVFLVSSFIMGQCMLARYDESASARFVSFCRAFGSSFMYVVYWLNRAFMIYVLVFGTKLLFDLIRRLAAKVKGRMFAPSAAVRAPRAVPARKAKGHGRR